MSANRPAFRVMKNGYDRFAVDDAIENYAVQIEQLERKVELYQNKLTETMRELEESKARCRQLISTDAARREAAENIARLSLREANDIINTANKNADIIIREALASARGILEDLSALYDEAGSVRTEASGQLEKLLKDFEDFRLPEMPDLMWLKEAEDKLR
ncbi:MAG: DivIVA domain-containing protein [Erysipelotrichaceae bacterium]|nr:DivIVA domain-containing protein [Erysipelotrichaceae bacterium]MDO5110194.1 DivIVA domain-containing protein [Erysipelotrichaceae bacterium]